MRIVEGVFDGKIVRISVPINAKPNTRVTIAFPDEGAADSTETNVTLDAVAGCLKWDGPSKTIEEMDEAIARGARESAS